jgi:hypothetical protein
LQDLGIGAAELLAALQVFEAHHLLLQPAVGPAAGPVDLPAGAKSTALVVEEVHLGEALAGAVAEDTAHVGAADPGVGVGVGSPHLDPAPVARHPWDAVEEGEAEGIQNGAFAGAGGTGDGEQAGVNQGRGVELHREVARQAGQVAAADGEDPHVSSASTASTSSWKAVASSGGGSASCWRR